MPGNPADTVRRPSSALASVSPSPQYTTASSENERVIIFCGCEAELLSFSCWPNSGKKSATAHDAPPPLELARPAVVSAWGPLLITSRVGGELTCLEVGSFSHPLLPRARVWRTSTLEFTFRQPAPNKFWTVKLPEDIPPALLRRLCSTLNSVCNFNTSCEPEEDTCTQEQMAADDAALDEAFSAQRLAGVGADGPTPLVLDAVQRISQRTLPVSAAHQVYTRDTRPAPAHSLRQVRKLDPTVWKNNVANDSQKDTRTEHIPEGSPRTDASELIERNYGEPRPFGENESVEDEPSIASSTAVLSHSADSTIQLSQELEPTVESAPIMWTPISSPKKMCSTDPEPSKEETVAEAKQIMELDLQTWTPPEQISASSVEPDVSDSVPAGIGTLDKCQVDDLPQSSFNESKSEPDTIEANDLESIVNMNLNSAGTVYSQLGDPVEFDLGQKDSDEKVDSDDLGDSKGLAECLSLNSPANCSLSLEHADELDSIPAGERTPTPPNLLPSLFDSATEGAFVPSPVFGASENTNESTVPCDLSLLKRRQDLFMDNETCFEPTPEPVSKPASLFVGKLADCEDSQPPEDVEVQSTCPSTPQTSETMSPNVLTPTAIPRYNNSNDSLDSLLETLEVRKKRQNEDAEKASFTSRSNTGPRRSVSEQLSRLIEVAVATTDSRFSINPSVDTPAPSTRAGSAPCSPVRRATLSAASAAEALKTQHRAISLQLRPPWQATKTSLLPSTSIRFTHPLVPLNSRSTIHRARSDDAIQLSPTKVGVQDVTTISGYISWQSMERHMNAFQ